MGLEKIIEKTKRIGRRVILTSLASIMTIGCGDNGEKDPIGPEIETTTPIPNLLPSIPNLKSPENGTTGISLEPILEWYPSTDPEGDPITYTINIFADYKKVMSTNTENTRYQFKPGKHTVYYLGENGYERGFEEFALESDVEYRWKIVATDDVIKRIKEGTKFEWSETWSFTTEPLEQRVSDPIPPKQPESVRIITPTETISLEEDDTFQLNNFQPSQQSVIIQKENNRTTFLTYIPPPSISLDPSSPLQEFREDIRITPQSTALSLVMLNPYLIEASNTEKVRIAERVLKNPRLEELADNIATNYEFTSISLTPEIFLESCVILKETLDSGGSQKLTGSDQPPFIRDDPGDVITLVNTQHVYYGVQIEASNLSLRDGEYLLPLRDGIFDYTFWPPGIEWAENTELSFSLPQGFFQANLTKGFNLDQLLENPAGHSAQATYANTGTALTKLISLAIKLPINIDYSTFPTSNAITNGMGKIIIDIRNNDTGKLIEDSANLIIRNSDEILDWLYNSNEENLTGYVGDALSIIADINVALKALRAADNVPFFYDLITAPRDVNYTFGYENGIIDFDAKENRAPRLSSINDKYVSEGGTLEFEVFAFDPDGDEINYSASNLPSWATFNEETREFIGTPGFYDAGTVRVVFIATDEKGASDSETISIEVGNRLRSPQLDPIGNKNINEGETLQFRVSATDQDADDYLITYTAEWLPEGATFEQGLFTWTPDYDQDGGYGVKFWAHDEDGGRDLERIWINVKNVPQPIEEPAPQPEEPREGLDKIIFSSNRDGNYEIYMMNPDGNNQERLTNRPKDDYNPVWSPNRDRVAFVSSDGVGSDIFLMDMETRDIRNITNDGFWDHSPSWSPDGSKIAFESDRRDDNFEIYVIDIENGDIRRLTNNPAPDFYPDWSPDGSKIAFTSLRDGNYEIYTMSPDGNSQKNLTNNPGEEREYRPIWSPDGSRIAFTLLEDRGGTEVYVMDSNGSNRRNLTNNYGHDTYPTWSPDGSRIAFASSRGVNDEIYVMDTEGNNQKNLTNHHADDIRPDWSPF